VFASCIHTACKNQLADARPICSSYLCAVPNCQALSIDDEADHQICAAFRCEARLLAPEEIREGREKLALTQKQFANLLGVGEATVSRWETGTQIQQRALDRFLRVCLASPAAVELLRNDFQPSATGA
jgi:putative zinc finger/helix-turn-helix YgiT family protein